MGIRLGLQNFDELFNQTTDPIIVNDLLDTLESEKNTFDENLFVTYTDTDVMDTVPRCQCGHTFGHHHIGNNGKATICRECRTPVQQTLDKPLEAIVWVQSPKGIEALMNPKAYGLMSDFFTLSGNSTLSFNIIKYLINPSYRPDEKKHARYLQEVNEIIEETGERRGLNNFYKNFDYYIEKISQLAPFNSTKEKRKKLEDIRKFIDMYRNEIFTQYLPIHNKTILVIENTKFGTYMDSTLKTIIDAVRNISGIDSEIKNFSIPQKESRSAKFIEAICEFGRDYEKSFISGKPGLVRKHVFATRCWFSFRAVINSLTEECAHDELHIPWSLAITVFRIHLMNKLFRKGFSHNESSYILNKHTFIYHEMLDEMLQELISESPHLCADGIRTGIPCIFGRNPSMYRASIQRMIITKVKTDPKIQSISFPIISTVGPNAGT